MIAYDLETTRIKAGETPRPLYLTAYGADWQASMRITSLAHLGRVLAARFLVPERNKVRYIAWNGNGFDAFLIARAILACPDYIVRPYLTRSRNLRGMRIIQKEGKDDKGRVLEWEFLDGISMTGLTGTKLDKFLATFAPDYRKLDAPDWECEEFDARNPLHVKYAERDSEGLWHAMQKAEGIVMDTFGVPLQPTIGNLGVRLFQQRMPVETTVWAPPYNVQQALRRQAMRGGYCYRARKYDGPIWKYDLNQAYAAAMRDAALPAGRCEWSPWTEETAGRPYIARVTASMPGNRVPFYYRGMDQVARTALDDLPETWLTSIEVEQLRAEGHAVRVLECYTWSESFNMRDFVGELETLRMNAPDGPSGAQGTMVKMIGNNSYGKTVEQLDGLELVMALDCPEGFSRYQNEDDSLEFVWYRFGTPQRREYHQPQIGAFITAHVRMVVRCAILEAPDAWLYADTDCVAFTQPVQLPIDPKRYGYWKCEEAGTEFWIIEKKVYASKDGRVMHAKGMNVRRLSRDDFAAWHAGAAPVQEQTQRANFVKFITGAEMFTARTRAGSLANKRKAA